MLVQWNGRRLVRERMPHSMAGPSQMNMCTRMMVLAELSLPADQDFSAS